MSRGKLSVVFKLKGGLIYSISNLVAISILKERKNEKVLKNIGGKYTSKIALLAVSTLPSSLEISNFSLCKKM